MISGNTGTGVSIDPGATNNVVPGNFIGTDATGERAVPNSAAGVLIGESSNNTKSGKFAHSCFTDCVDWAR